MSDISLTGNDIEIATTKSPDGSRLVGSKNLVDPDKSKVKLTLARAKTHDDKGQK
jgi:hypothetical protein